MVMIAGDIYSIGPHGNWETSNFTVSKIITVGTHGFFTETLPVKISETVQLMSSVRMNHNLFSKTNTTIDLFSKINTTIDRVSRI